VLDAHDDDGGMLMATFTPLKGIGDVIMGFMDKELATTSSC
jgi:phage terminase large subunit-like protein